MKRKFNVATIIGLMLLVAVITFTITYLSVEKQFQEQLAIEKSRDNVFSKLNKIIDLIDGMYIGEYNPEDLIDVLPMA